MSPTKRRTIAIRELISLNGGSLPVQPETIIPKGAFVGLTITDAAIQYLEIMDEPQTNRQVVDALTQGGITSEARDFSNTVRAILLREHEKPDGKLRWKAPHWRLTECDTSNEK